MPLDELFVLAQMSGMSIVCPLDRAFEREYRTVPTDYVYCYNYASDTWDCYHQRSDVFSGHVLLYAKAKSIRDYRIQAGLVPNRPHQGGIFHPPLTKILDLHYFDF